jgi:hypothetical protein
VFCSTSPGTKIQAASGGEVALIQSADFILVAIPPGNHPGTVKIRNLLRALTPSRLPIVLNHKFVLACYEAGRLADTDEFRVTFGPMSDS